MTARDRQRAARRLERARQLFAELAPEQRAQLFREFGNCACAMLVKGAVQNPAAAVGALVGGLVGAALMPTEQHPVIGSPPPHLLRPFRRNDK